MNYHTFNFKSVHTEVKRTSDFLDGLVRDYRVGASGSSEALLEAFMPLIAKYYRLLTAGVWDIDDPDITGFLKMLGTSDLEQTSERLVRAMKNYESDDIKHELVLILFNTAKKYTNISSNFKYVAKTRIIALIHDPLIYRSITLDAAESRTCTVDDKDIDQAWVNGLTVGDGWDQLTSVERAVIKYIYHDGLGDAVAAKKLHVTVRQLRRYKKASKDKLAKYFNL